MQVVFQHLLIGTPAVSGGGGDARVRVHGPAGCRWPDDGRLVYGLWLKELWRAAPGQSIPSSLTSRSSLYMS